jgi:hypothetical protein
MDQLLSQLAELGSPFAELNVNQLQMQETWIEVLEWLLKSYDSDLFNSVNKGVSDEQMKFKGNEIRGKLIINSINLAFTSLLSIIGLANAHDLATVQVRNNQSYEAISIINILLRVKFQLSKSCRSSTHWPIWFCSIEILIFTRGIQLLPQNT